MHIEYGNTRVVFLFSLFVVKFPRVRFSDALKTLIDRLRGKPVGIKGDKFEGRPLMTALAYLFSGATSNRREYTFAKKHPLSGNIITSYTLLLGGIVHIQKRGHPLREDDPRWRHFVSLLEKRGADNPDLCNRDNFSECGGTMCIHDCGWRLSVEMLDEFALDFLSEANAHRHNFVPA